MGRSAWPRPGDWRAVAPIRASSLDVALAIFAALVGDPGFTTQQGWRLIGVAAACAILIPPSYRSAEWLMQEPRKFIALVLGLTAIAIFVQLGRERAYEFIYFQF